MSGKWVVRNRRRARTGRATSNIGEIAANLRRRRNPRLPNLATALAVPLFRPEEEDFVLLDRTTDGVAEVVAAQKVLLSAHRIAGDAADFLLAEEKVFGIEHVVAAVIVGIPVKLVSATFRDEVDLGAASSAILWTVAVAQDLKFLDGVHRGIDENGALRSYVIVIGPVHLPLVGVGRCAAERDVHPRQQPLILIVKPSSHGSARHQCGQLDEVAAVQWQLAHLVAQHDVADFAVFCIQIDRRGLHGHRFRRRPHLQLYRARRHRSNVHWQVPLRHRLEPLLGHSKGVGPDGELAEAEIALRVRGRLAFSSGSLVSQRQGAAGNRSTGLVSHRSANIAGGCLGKRKRQKHDRGN